MPGLDKPPPDTGFNPQQNSENPYVSIHFSLLISKRRNEDLQKPVQKFEVGFEDLHLLHLLLKVRNVNLHFFFLISKVRNVSIHGKYCRKGYPPTTFSAISAAIPKFLRKFASS